MYIINKTAYDDSMKNELVVNNNEFLKKFGTLCLTMYKNCFWKMPDLLESQISNNLYYLYQKNIVETKSLSEILESPSFKSSIIYQLDKYKNESIIIPRDILSLNNEYEEGILKFSKTEFLKDESRNRFDFIKSDLAVPNIDNIEMVFVLTTSVIPLQELLDKENYSYYVLNIPNMNELKNFIRELGDYYNKGALN